MVLIEPQNQHLAWATKIGDHVYISEAPRSLAGPGQRWYTTPAIEVETSAPVFIKDIWRDPQRLFQEFELFRRAHEGGALAGLMRVYAHRHVLNESKERVTTAAHQFGLDQRREKMRLVTEDIGRPLETVQSLRQFLSVMYDACALQRNLYRKCGILHRDISDRNIMLAPVGEDYRFRGGYAEVKFLNQVLQADDKAGPEPTCLVIDLGNGADLNVPRAGDQLRQRTGTPKFIARSVSSGMPLDRENRGTTGVLLPSTDGINEYIHRMHTTEYQHEFPNARTETGQQFAHQLFHDAESTFWVIAWTLVRSASQGYQGEQNQDMRFRWFYHLMCRHYPVLDDDDTHDWLCQISENYWTSLLHPDLQSMGSMLSGMFAYVYPEWAFSPLNPEHVHEALMRLMLAEIVKLNNEDISLVVGARWIPPLPEIMLGLSGSLGSISGSGSFTSAI
ncbi:hypothetical protein RSOLAG22IIIB_03302 [Rhizoctonia solani]|uniref:Fungal-type protein kinase domain-containing protein n=1 Tax=Rhizoctonia solani TaxID=456999 RepID=A0A0K6FNP4_9AGAM|nr:hypothetical protein RSOLAG22IIIB_03302 [Rhizoctonia solani]